MVPTHVFSLKDKNILSWNFIEERSNVFTSRHYDKFYCIYSSVCFPYNAYVKMIET